MKGTRSPRRKVLLTLYFFIFFFFSFFFLVSILFGSFIWFIVDTDFYEYYLPTPMYSLKRPKQKSVTVLP